MHAGESSRCGPEAAQRYPGVRSPIFIVGCGRSGTTLLFDLLSQHPGVRRTRGYPDGEDHTGWNEHGACAMSGNGNVHAAQYGSGITGPGYCLHLTAADATPTTIEAMRGYYWRDVLAEDARYRVLNKNPHLSNKLGYVLRLFPDARVVHIVRDCEPMVASWLAVMRQHAGVVAYLPDDPYPCYWLFPRPAHAAAHAAMVRDPRFHADGGGRMWVEYWTRVNSGVAPQMGAHAAQLHVVRYEDLVRTPRRILADVERFCGLDRHRYVLPAIDADTAARHRALVPDPLRAAIAGRAAEVRAQFGYASPAAPAAACA